MDEDVKVCPGCGAEFLPHVEVCNKCDLQLIRPGEERPAAVASDDNEAALVLLEVGSADDMKWFQTMLKKKGFRPQVLNLSGGAGCCSSENFGIFVEEPFAVDALKRLDEIRLQASPELREMNEQISAGRCPACGANISCAIYNCPDCGLPIG